MTRRTLFSALYLVASALLLVGISGCNAMNDNPVSADQMHTIRQKEAAGRADFHPSGAPPPNAR